MKDKRRELEMLLKTAKELQRQDKPEWKEYLEEGIEILEKIKKEIDYEKK